MKRARIQAIADAIIETVDHVPSWSPAEADAFALGFVRGLRHVYRRDPEVWDLLRAIGHDGVVAVRVRLDPFLTMRPPVL